MKTESVAGRSCNTITSPANNTFLVHVTNFTNDLFQCVADNMKDYGSNHVGTHLGEVTKKIEDWEIEYFQRSIEDFVISFSMQTYKSEKYNMLQELSISIRRISNVYQFVIKCNNHNYGCSLDNIGLSCLDIINFLNKLAVVDNSNDIENTGPYKQIWDWRVLPCNVSDIKFETTIKPKFSNRAYFSNCSPVDLTSARPAYFGDTDGFVGAVLYAMFSTGHLGITADGECYLKQLLELEDKALKALPGGNTTGADKSDLNTMIDILTQRDAVLENLQPCLFFNKDALTPCILLGDNTGDRFSSINSDKFIIDLLKSLMNVNNNVHVLAGNHETNCNGNYMLSLTRTEPLNEDTYEGIKDYDICSYDAKTRIMASHYGIIFDYKFKCYVIGAITVAISEMKDACDPIELAEIINKKYHGIINDKDFKSSRALPHLTSNQYFSCSTNYRPGREDILKCSNILSINQIIAHNGNGGKELIGKTGAVLGLNARDYKHPNKLFSLHNCQINLDSALEEATPWRVYQHEKNKAKPLPDFRKSTMLWL
ncbi:DUF4049 domain-containing protein [Escherichia albertii]